MITRDEFFNKNNGKYIDFDNAFGFQCYDLFLFYLRDVLNINPSPYQGWGTAKNCYLNFVNINGASKYFDLIANSPTNAPQPGDIVFWGTYLFVTGTAGHVAICSSVNVNTLVTFDQNYPTGSPCHFVTHSYKGVMGWWHPKSIPPNDQNTLLKAIKDVVYSSISPQEKMDKLLKLLENQ